MRTCLQNEHFLLLTSESANLQQTVWIYTIGVVAATVPFCERLIILVRVTCPANQILQKMLKFKINYFIDHLLTSLSNSMEWLN